ncbi:hypothetical protein DIPPA_17937 [Diplonema papillatum]|nr:hypothetical protein DIPPA_17937 [Diplonema papillatum]|eukprot:gene6566-10032_t
MSSEAAVESRSCLSQRGEMAAALMEHRRTLRVQIVGNGQASEPAATAYFNIGRLLCELGRGVDAVEALCSALRAYEAARRTSAPGAGPDVIAAGIARSLSLAGRALSMAASQQAQRDAAEQLAAANGERTPGSGYTGTAEGRQAARGKARVVAAVSALIRAALAVRPREAISFVECYPHLVDKATLSLTSAAQLASPTTPGLGLSSSMSFRTSGSQGLTLSSPLSMRTMI